MKTRTGDLRRPICWSLAQVVCRQLLSVHVSMLLLRIQHHILSSDVDSNSAPIPQKPPQQAPFAPSHTMLTEKTHLLCIVEIFINNNFCHSGGASAQRENIQALFESITQVVRKFVLMQYE